METGGWVVAWRWNELRFLFALESVSVSFVIVVCTIGLRLSYFLAVLSTSTITAPRREKYH